MAQLQYRVSRKTVNDTLKEAIKPKAADVPAFQVMQLQPAAKSLSGSEINSLKVAQPQNIPTNIGNLDAQSGDVIALTLAAETQANQETAEETQTYISSDEITEGANAFYDESQTDVIPVDETPTTDAPADTQQTTTDAGNADPKGTSSAPPVSGNYAGTGFFPPYFLPAAPSQNNTSNSNTTSNKDGNKMPLYIGLAIAAVVIILFITK